MGELLAPMYTERKAQLDQVALKADPVLVCDPRRQTNADLLFDAMRIGWVGELVFDATSGQEVFWQRWRPAELHTNDLHVSSAHWCFDYLKPWEGQTLPEVGGTVDGADLVGAFDTVVFDPPYQLNGKPTDFYGSRYGLAGRVRVPQRLAEIRQGAVNCARLVAPDGTLLVKCMDQVSLFEVHFQTQMVIEAIAGLKRFKLLGLLELTEPKPRTQDKQVTPRFNRSTLLAFHRYSAKPID